ncbi:HDL402Wp [Eremothecium sinecaudum]|uniref:HDL402Wp n=1 Tax=Eremothecium sinecaudum TaxID=45286 RepID=A0A109UWU6_9SACH|nr:HDL402Wp [Eremothecium sinecaudum]AMD20342.1 HDL402Wp [Eremothecium sinecaudum]
MPYKPISKPISARDGIGRRLYKLRLALLSKKRRNLQFTLGGILAGIGLVLYLISNIVLGTTPPVAQPPAKHGYYFYEIELQKPYIFPEVNHINVLRQMGLNQLFVRRIDEHGNSFYIYKENDPPLTEKNRKENSEATIVKKMFLDTGKKTYKKVVGHPEVVIVSLVDFERYDKDTVTRIIKNRYDYAYRQQYGIYVRWAQEFIPMVQQQTIDQSYEYMKPLIMRAAMHAFPRAKYFWFIDQEGLIMNMDFSLEKHLLSEKVFKNIVLKGVPVIKDSTILTHRELPMSNVKMIIPHTPNGQIETNSFIITPSLYGKAFLDYLSDPLIRNYKWEHFGDSVGHMLQWHPKMLSRTALIKPKVISAVYDPADKNSDQKKPEDIENSATYTDDDVVILFKGCRERGTCPAEIAEFYEKY